MDLYRKAFRRALTVPLWRYWQGGARSRKAKRVEYKRAMRAAKRAARRRLRP
jgi:hypothetical protein